MNNIPNNISLSYEIWEFVLHLIVPALGTWGLIALSIGKYKEKIDTLVKNGEILSLDVKEIKSTLQNFGQRIASLETACGINEHISLTEEGKAVLAESGGKDFDDDNKK